MSLVAALNASGVDLLEKAFLLISLTLGLLSSRNMVTRTKKIFVGGLSAPTTLEDVKSYFEQFGPYSIYCKFLQEIISSLNYFNQSIQTSGLNIFLSTGNVTTTASK
uniref:RRM domain-containing protein n=1 Tax=Glossina austeni TaxID=7395 RepID=A0A1A9VHJ1_GLOAU